MTRTVIEALKSFVKYLEEESNRELEASSDFMDGVRAGYIDALDEFKCKLDESGCVTPTEFAEITGAWKEGADIDDLDEDDFLDGDLEDQFARLMKEGDDDDQSNDL